MDSLPKTPKEYRMWWTEQRPDVPYGRCWCGCNEMAPVSAYTNKQQGYYKGEPRRYVYTHQTRGPRPTQRKPIAERYQEEDRGYETPCWVWIGSIKENGYGVLDTNGHQVSAHRVVYESVYGPLPDYPHFHLHHLCEVPCCVNPGHMQVLTAGKHARIRRTTVLTEEKVRQIKRLRLQGYTCPAIAQKFGLNKWSVHNIDQGKTWKDVQP